MVENKQPNKTFADKIKLSVGDLRPGMYVCELDRPWLETPFLLQGFEVKDFTDIKVVMEHCHHVYIDVERSRVAKVTADDLPRRAFPGTEKAAPLRAKGHGSAAATRKQTSNLVRTFLDDIALGKSPDTQLAFGAVSECVASVIRNPEAMMFLTQLRGRNEGASQQSLNVCIYSIMLGRLLGLDSYRLEHLGTAALLHDMGLMAIPKRLLDKPGMLDDEELSVVQTHAKQGRDILMSGRNIYSGAVDVAYGHHESLDGSGYPRGLQAHQLNLNCKIVAVADKYDALTSPMAYRPAGDHLSAVNILNSLARSNKIDAEITSRFVSYLGVYPPGSIVELSSGEVAVVLESNATQRLRPKILVVLDADKAPTRRFVDLAETAGRPCRIVSVCQPGDFGIEAGYYHTLVMRDY